MYSMIEMADIGCQCDAYLLQHCILACVQSFWGSYCNIVWEKFIIKNFFVCALLRRMKMWTHKLFLALCV